MITFSIVTVVRNDLNGIILTNDSINNQTYKNFNVIISDHSLDDNIKNLCNSYSDKFEIKYIKKVVLLEKAQFLKIRGAQADPAAFNATRFWVTTGVKVEIKDRKDPTPYWLISSRKAKYLSKALN